MRSDMIGIGLVQESLCTPERYVTSPSVKRQSLFPVIPRCRLPGTRLPQVPETVASVRCGLAAWRTGYP